MNKYILLLLMSLFAIMAKGQNIDFTLPAHANKPYVFYVNNGLKSDTIGKGTISMVGVGRLTIPEKYKSVPAMGLLEIEGVDPIALILNNETFSFSTNEKGELSFVGSNENDLLYNKQSEIVKKENEATYAMAYVKTVNALKQMNNVLTKQGQASLMERSSAKLAALNDVDIDKLYYGRFWFFVLDGLFRMSSGQEGFANDMIRLLDKTKTEKVYVAFVEDIIMITNQYGWDDAFDIIIPHVEQSGRIEYPQGSVYDAFAMARVRKGTKAPIIEGLAEKVGSTNHQYTLVMFHQPSCENCHEQLKLLVKDYESFVKSNVRIVTISGALESSVFKEETGNFVWKDKLCDYNGFAGRNFLNFGIIGTPTMYLLDNNNMVLGRFALVSEIEKYLRSAL